MIAFAWLSGGGRSAWGNPPEFWGRIWLYVGNATFVPPEPDTGVRRRNLPRLDNPSTTI